MHNPRTNETGANRHGTTVFLNFFNRHGSGMASAAQKIGRVVLRSNFGRKFAPDSIHSREWDGLGRVRLPELGGIAMGPAYLSRKQDFLDEQETLDESPLREEEYTDEEYSDGVLSLLEENARLRGLVIKLTDLILKNVANQK